MPYLFALFILIFCSGLKSAPIELFNNAGEYPLGRYLEYYEDESSSLSFKQISSGDTLFSKGKTDELNFGFSRSSYWLKLEISTAEKLRGNWIIEFRYPLVDLLEVYIELPDGRYEKKLAGDSLQFWEREVDHVNPSFLFENGFFDGQKIYFKVSGQDSIQIPITIWQERSFYENNRDWTVFYGLYYGVMICILLVNLFIFASIKDIHYLVYSFYVASYTLVQLYFNGLGFQYFWGDSPMFQRIGEAMLIGNVLFAGTYFGKLFLDIEHMEGFWWPVLRIMMISSVLVALCSFFFGQMIMVFIAVGLALMVSVYGVLVGLKRLREGFSPAKFWVLAWTAFLIGVLVFCLKLLGLMESNLITSNIMQIGSLWEVILLNFALADRIRVIEEQKEMAQQEALRVQTEYAANLEAEVKKQTFKLMEANQQLATLDRQKTHFFQNISHELRTPLTLIMAPLDEAMSGQGVKENVAVAAKNSKRLYRLVNQLLDFQKIAAGKKELDLIPIDLIPFTHTCADYFASACSTKNIDFKVQMDGKEVNWSNKLLIAGEADALEKIIFNFLSNALKFTPLGGKIELGLETLGNYIRVYVKDSGPGISDKDQAKLFNVFSQTESSENSDIVGTGLGLALVKELSEKMDAKVGVISKPDEGALFFADFPVIRSLKPVLDLLVVEDEELVLKGLEELFETSAQIREYKTASNLADAREIISHYKIRALICDANLPDGNGIELLSELSKLEKKSKLILLTGNTDQSTLERSINEASIDKVFYKPWIDAELLNLAEEYVRSSKIRDPETMKEFRVKTWHLLEEKEEEVESFISEQSFSRELILVVDDLKDMRNLIANCLKKRSYPVIMAENGKEALELARERKPMLIISDWMMPVMSGPDLIKEVRADSEIASTPIVLLTAKTDEESKLAGTEIGADAFLGKPFNDAELSSTVRNLIKLKASEARVLELNRNITENILKRYLPSNLIEDVLSGDVVMEKEPDTQLITVLFSDLHGFTSLTDKLRAKKTATVLNQYLDRMIGVIGEHGGTIDKFIGDAIMVFWGAPKKIPANDQAKLACSCAKAMQAAMEELNKDWALAAVPELNMRIGINHGPAVVGSFGNEKRSDYSAIGPSVNLASRIETVCKPGDVYVSKNVSELIGETEFEQLGDYELKGIEDEVMLFRLRRDI